MKEILLVKNVFDAFNKNLKKGKFWQKRMKMLYPPPPSSFFAMMTQDIQIAKFLNSLLKMANI